jgi:hypothetical protein
MNPAMARVANFFMERGFAAELQDGRFRSANRHSNYRLALIVAHDRREIPGLIVDWANELALTNRIYFSDAELEEFVDRHRGVRSRKGTVRALIRHKRDRNRLNSDILYSVRNNWLRTQVSDALANDGEPEERRVLVARWLPILSYVSFLLGLIAWVGFGGQITVQGLAGAVLFTTAINMLRPIVEDEE